MLLNEFIKNNQTFMNEQLIDREKELYKYIRNVSLLDLYTECLETEPVYVPRKWRNDNYHVMSERELTVLTNLELKRFQTECEILRLRRDDFKQRTEHIDKNITEFIEKENISLQSKEWLLKRWEECIREDENKITKKWEQKLRGTRNQFEKDREFIQHHRTKRIKKNTEFSRKTALNKNTESNNPRTSSSRSDDQSKNTQTSTHRFNLRSLTSQKDH